MNTAKQWLLLTALALMALMAAGCGAESYVPQEITPPPAEERPATESELLSQPTPPLVPKEPGKTQESPPQEPNCLEAMELKMGQCGDLRYAFGEADKEEVQALSMAQYIKYGNTLRGQLRALTEEDIYWFTIRFADGTGICWHDISIEQASYGRLDEFGRITEVLAYLPLETRENHIAEVHVVPPA